MAVVSVSFDGTRVNNSDSNTSWGNYSSSGGAPASEPQLAYQGTGAVNKKITETTGRGGVDYDPASGALDMTAAANKLCYFKGVVADFGDLNSTYGVEYAIGSSNADFYSYNVAGTGANRAVFNSYPAQGGYLIVAIDPNISAWRESTTGTPVLTAVDWFAIAAQFVTGGAKSENVALDAIDVGSGLTLVGGDGVSADGTFIDFLSTDQDNTSNRWGVCVGTDPVVTARGILTIGSATATEFNDSISVVLFPDGYHSAGTFGVSCDLSNATTSITVDCTLIGLGSSTTEDTRPDFTWTGTSGTGNAAHTLSNFRNYTLTSAVTLDGANINISDLTQASGTIQNSTIECNSATGVAVCNDITAANLSNINWIQVGSGHAIEITSTGSYDFDAQFFDSFGADGTTSAAIYNNSGGVVTINIQNGGDNPTVRNGTGASTTLNNAVTVRVTVQDSDGTLIQNARVYLVADTGGSLSAGTEILSNLSNASGVVEDTSFNYTSDQPVTGRVRKSSTSPYYKTAPLTGTININGFQTIAIMLLDE